MNQPTQQDDKTTKTDDPASLTNESTGARTVAYEALASELHDLIRKDSGNTPESLQDDVQKLAYDDIIATVELYSAGHTESAALTTVKDDLIAVRDLAKEYSHNTRQLAVAHIPHVDFLRECAAVSERTETQNERVQDKLLKKVMEAGIGMTKGAPNSKQYEEQQESLLDLKEEIGTPVAHLDFDAAIDTLSNLQAQAAQLETQRVDVRTANDEVLRSLQEIIKRDL